MQQPAIRRRVHAARDAILGVRHQVEAHLEDIEADLRAWIRQIQEEARQAERQIRRKKDSETYYRRLGLQPGATLNEVKAAWRKKMRETHPDRFAHDPRAEAAAHERALKINEAYQELTALLTGRENRRAT